MEENEDMENFLRDIVGSDIIVQSNGDIEFSSSTLAVAVQPPVVSQNPETSHAETDNVQLKKQSPAWRYFKKESEVTARCTLCNKVCKHSGNTTNMTQHLTSKHALFYTAAMNAKRKSNTTSESSNGSVEDSILPPKKKKFQSNKGLTTIHESFERMNSFKGGGKTAEKITNAILFMIAVDKMPLSTVENEGFQWLLKTILPLYALPSRKTVTRLVDARYDVLKERFVDKLAKSATSTYTLTCDNWTDVSNQSYLGLTVHYVTDDLQMENGCIGVFPLDERHTAQYLEDTLKSVIEDFGLSHSQITAVVTDSAANIKKAVRDLFGKDKQMGCFAHSLSHLVPSALGDMPVVREMIAKVKSIVTVTRRSVVASDELKKLQIRDGKTEGTALRFIQDVATRWNSTLYMLERFLLLEQYVYPVISKCPNAPDMLMREEIQTLKDLVSLMKPVARVITDVSGDSYPTCSVVIPRIHCLEDSIEKYSPSTKYGQQFKEKLQAHIAFRFLDFERVKILAISTILDPRFKKLPFQSALAASSAISTINDLLNAKADRRTYITTDTVPKEQSNEDNPWSFYDNLVASKTGSDKSNEGLSFEFRQYLNQRVISRHEDPLQYWKTLKLAFPSLYEIAVEYVSIVGTSVPSERLFSQAGDIKTDNRSRLTGEHLNKLLFLSSLARKDWGLD